jgi:acyl carrier protein
MKDCEIKDKVYLIVAKSFDIDAAQLSHETKAEDIDGWDSLAHATLLLRLQRTFNVDLDLRAANAAQTLGALVTLVQNSIRARNG